MFVDFCGAGHELMGLHLMEDEVLEDMEKWPGFDIEGDNEVCKGYPKYVMKDLKGDGGKDSRGVEPDPTANDQNGDEGGLGDGGKLMGRVYINKDQYFEGVSEEVWEFCVGGYQVCDKWLKDRRGRKLSYDEIKHYQKICVVLGETKRIMRGLELRF